MNEDSNKKLTVRERLAYSFGALGNDAFYGLMSGWLVVFITSHLFIQVIKQLTPKWSALSPF